MADKDSGDKQPWVVPVLVAVVGAFSAVAVAWINKPQPSPSPAITSSILPSPNSTAAAIPPSPSQAASVALPLVRLKTFWEPGRKDNYPLALPETEEIITSFKPLYREVRTEGCIFSTQIKGTIPLKNYWNAQYGDNYPLASLESKDEAIRDGYTFIGRVEGYIYAEKVENSVPLETYWNGFDRRDHYPIASMSGREWAKSNNYVYLRIEGYIAVFNSV